MSDRILPPAVKTELADIKAQALARKVTADLVLQERITANLAQLDKTEIADDDGEVFVFNWRKGLSLAIEVVKAHHEPERIATHSAHKAVTDAIASKVKLLEAGFQRAGKMLSDYRRKKEEAAEKKRLEDEAAARKAAEEKIIEEAVEADDETILDEPIIVAPPPPVHIAAPAGTGYVDVWVPEVTSLKDLAAAVAAGEVPEKVIEACMPELRKIGVALGAAAKVRGVSFTKVSRPRDSRKAAS